MSDAVKSGPSPRKRLRLYSKLDARFDDNDEDPRASLVNLVDVMLVFACGLLAAVSAGAKNSASMPQHVEKGREIARPAVDGQAGGAGYDRIGDVFRDPKSGKLILIEPQSTPTSTSTSKPTHSSFASPANPATQPHGQ
mgnify:CR=1 FL=1